jgi:hypothetical protein
MSDPKNNGQGRTLWEMLKLRLSQGDSAIPFHNPLDLKIGSLMPLSKGHPELASFDFTVKELREYTRRIGGKEFKFTDYVLAGTNTKTFDSDDALIARLRVVPNQAGANDVLLLRVYDEIAFDEDFLAVVKDTTGLFEIKDDSGNTEQYHRINDVRDSYEAAVLIVTSTTDDGKAAAGKATAVKLEYWDYWRDTPIGDGATTKKQFLFVEMDSDSGWFQIWRGEEFFL